MNDVLTTERLSTFTKALKAAIAASTDLPERDAIRTFVHVLERMAANRKAFTLQEWCAHSQETGALTSDEQSGFLEIMKHILDNDKAVDDLLSTMEGD